MFAYAKVSRGAVGLSKQHGEMEAWGSTAKATDTRFDKHERDMTNSVPLVYPKCCLGLSAFLRQDENGNMGAHLPDLADHSK